MVPVLHFRWSYGSFGYPPGGCHARNACKSGFFDSSPRLMFQFDPSGFADLTSNGGK